MATFCKNEDCPASELLLAFVAGELGRDENDRVRKHISDCEFCAAEVEFYQSFPQSEDAEEPVEAEAIPRPLFELAHALLSKKGIQFFDGLFEEDRDVSLSGC